MNKIKDNILMSDGMRKNKIIAFDEHGNKLFERENLVVQRGRVFALESIFDNFMSQELAGEHGFKGGTNRKKIALFKIGKGGTAIGTPFTPTVVNANETELTDPVPFRVVDPGDSSTTLSELEKDIYCCPIVDEDGKTLYFGKRFEEDAGSWDIDLTIDDPTDTTTNLISYLINFEISDKDARNSIINEVGIYFAEVDGDGKPIDGTEELFSKINFSSEKLDGYSSKYFVYCVYA